MEKLQPRALDVSLKGQGLTQPTVLATLKIIV